MNNFETFLADNYDLAKESYKFKSWEVVKEKFSCFDTRREIGKKYRGLYWSPGSEHTPHLPTCGNTGFNIDYESFTYLKEQDDGGEYYNRPGEITVKPVLCGNNVDELYRQLYSIGAEKIGQGYCTYDKATFCMTSQHPWFEVVTPVGYEFKIITIILEGYGVVRTKDFPSNLIVTTKVVEAMKEAREKERISGGVELCDGCYDDADQDYKLEDYL